MPRIEKTRFQNSTGECLSARMDWPDADVQLAGRDFIIKQQFIDDLEQASVAEDIAGLNKALLVMHAARDDTVAIANAAQIFQLAHHPKSYISLDQADHLMSKPADATYVGQMIAVWARRYVDSL
ncbi:hypothetical protein JYT48_02290 [Mariprofundus ferrooxydans]|nr:hypothetical protein [Mariprofundus ferrooxydans]